MMGGFGSGRPIGSGRDKVEYSRSIDVNRLHKAGCLGRFLVVCDTCRPWGGANSYSAQTKNRAGLFVRAGLASNDFQTQSESIWLVSRVEVVGRARIRGRNAAIRRRPG